MGLDLRTIRDVQLLGFGAALAARGEGGIKAGSPISGWADLVDGVSGTRGEGC